MTGAVKLDPKEAGFKKKSGFTTGKTGKVRLQAGELRLQAGTLRQVASDLGAVLRVTAALRSGEPPQVALGALGPDDDWVLQAMLDAPRKLFDPDAADWVDDEPVAIIDWLMAVLDGLQDAYLKVAVDLGTRAVNHRAGAPKGTTRTLTIRKASHDAPADKPDSPEALVEAIRKAQTRNPTMSEIDVLREFARQELKDAKKRTAGSGAISAIERRAQALQKRLRRFRSKATPQRTA